MLTKNREYTQKRISNARSVLNGILTYAVEEEILLHNPLVDVNLKNLTYKAVENQDDVFSVKDAVKLLKHLEYINDPYALAIRLDFNLLIRIGELEALTWDCVNWKDETIYIHKQCNIERTLNDDMSFSPRNLYISNQIKGNTSCGFRTQPLTPEALCILHKAKELNPTGKFIFMPNERIMRTDTFNRR